MTMWMKSLGMTIPMKATEQYFPVALFILLYKVVLTFESVGETLWCDHSNTISTPLLSSTREILFFRCLYDHLTNDVIIFLKLTSNSDVRWRFHFSCVVRCYASIVSRCLDFWNKQRLTVATACFPDEIAIASPTDVRFWIAFCRAV